MWQHPFVLLLQLSRDHSKDSGDADPFSETTTHVSNLNWNGNKHSSSQKLNLCEVNKYLLQISCRWVGVCSSYVDPFSVLFAVFSLVREASEPQKFGKGWIHIHPSSLPASCSPVFWWKTQQGVSTYITCCNPGFNPSSVSIHSNTSQNHGRSLLREVFCWVTLLPALPALGHWWWVGIIHSGTLTLLLFAELQTQFVCWSNAWKASWKI